MLPETLLCLLNVAFVFAQTRQQLSLNVISSFTPSNIPNPPLFTLPQSKNLSITVALCSTAAVPRFFLSNSSSAVPGSGSGPQGTEITITDGYGEWTGPVSDGSVLSVEGAGTSSFELAVSEDGALPFMRSHNHINVCNNRPDTRSSANTTVFRRHYLEPGASLFCCFLASSSNKTDIPELHTSVCEYVSALTSRFLTEFHASGWAVIILVSIDIFAPDRMYAVCTAVKWYGTKSIVMAKRRRRLEITMVSRRSNTRHELYCICYTRQQESQWSYIFRDKVRFVFPVLLHYEYCRLKIILASFRCPLVFGLPYCPSIAYSVPLPSPPSGANVYDVSNVPPEVTAPLLSILTNFTVMLTTTACGRDLYSPIVGCDDCEREYRRWLCTITFTRCGEPSPSNPNGVSATPPAPDATGLSAFRPVAKGQPKQAVLSALMPQSSNASEGRNPNLAGTGSTYMMLLPCLERCATVDRACPTFLGFKCPVVRFNAAASYGVGYVDSVTNEVGKGVTGVAQDRWGNVWCNGG